MFKASNGIQFERRENGAIVVSGGLLDPEFTITPAAASGLRQFFLHERGENTRPWEDAKPGEVWELDGDYYLADAGRFFRLPPVTPSDPSWRPPSFASEFKSGERFYPAGD